MGEVRRRDSPKGRRRRDELLDIALDVFGAEGYRGTSIRSIAHRAGITVAGLLHHFGSREQLLVEVLRRRDEVARLERAAAHIGDGWEGLVQTMRENALTPGLTELFVTLAAAARHPEHPAREMLAERYRDLEQQIVSIIERDRDRLGLDPGADLGRLARLVIAIADGAQLQWMVVGDHALEEPLTTLWSDVLGQPEPGASGPSSEVE